MKRSLLILLFFFGITSLTAQFLEKKSNLTYYEGFFNFHYSEADGEIYLEVPKDRLDTEFLYVHSLRTGLGSNDIGLDRGQLGDQRLVYFTKSGNKLLLIQPNLRYRATTTNELERRSIEEAFARSVLFGFEIKETKGENYIIDLTPFLMEDMHGVANRLKSGEEGTYKLEKSRNTIWMERTKSFPKNTEFEAMLTFVGEPKGRNLPSVAPDASSVSIIQHYSFVALPDDAYTPREFDPRSGSFSISYLDYSTPIWEPIKKQFITRHRLEKKDPSAAVSEAKEPIVYYLDPGTPEPVRSALLDGAKWWDQAFESIGYKNAFQVKLLPEDADPMDVRYNVIQWVHRSTRGWSYGGSVIDPRTGEIIKGHVSLGSLRIRQDFMIAQALMNQPYAERDDNYQPMLDMALARIRQLSAHEVGHTLGFAHNFAASTNGRASVMDYPHPLIQLKEGRIDFSDAYDAKIGAWDKVTVAYSYGDIPKGVSEKVYLQAILESAYANGLRYITDSDARAKGGAHVSAHLWDNGNNASESLEQVLDLRAHAINNFSEDNIRTGRLYSVLEDVFVPLYFYHRYQTEAAVKLIGGLDYTYAVKGYSGTVVKTLPKKIQEEALQAVLRTLQPKVLMIPEEKLALFPPRAYGFSRSRESFKSDMGVAFDALGAAATSANMTLELLLHPERANRLVQQKALDPLTIGLQEVLQQLLDQTFTNESTSAYEKEVRQAIQFETLQQLIILVASKQSIAQTKAITNESIDTLAKTLSRNDDAFSRQLLREIAMFREKPENYKVAASPKIPDGSPIGSLECIIPN
ncbi:MAG: zinc-dependent metalloprotease [Flavobacteriales bacterium]|nr:zinc-dependent metalloprotease [Flavobacteriales bacterium]